MALWHVIIVVGMLATGATNTVMTNLQNLSNSYIHNRLPIQWISFSHPWFQTWLMFLGEALLIIVFLTNVESFRRAPEYASGKVVFRKFQPILIVPTLCDLTGSTVGNFALLLISASVWQMLRASNIIFTGILSVIFLRRRLHLFHWLGMSLVAIGITTVGVSSMLNAKDGGEHTQSTTHTIIGCCLVLVSQLIAACQMVLEETLLKNSHFPAVQVVGSEGVIGIVLMTCIVLPVVNFAFPASNPLHDNAIQALTELANNHALFFFCLIFVISIAFYNYFAQSVVKELTAVHRTLIDACRTIAVWVVQLIIHYGINHNFGEEWMKFSWIQVIGFVFVVIGTLIYNKIIQVPGLYYPAPEGKEMTHQTEDEKLVN